MVKIAAMHGLTDERFLSVPSYESVFHLGLFDSLAQSIRTTHFSDSLGRIPCAQGEPYGVHLAQVGNLCICLSKAEKIECLHRVWHEANARSNLRESFVY